MYKVTIYGVRPYEVELFNTYNIYSLKLDLISENLTKSNVKFSKQSDGVIVRGNCILNKEILQSLNNFGINFIVTRSKGINHIDMDYATKNGFLIENIENYSKESIAELVLYFILTLNSNYYKLIQPKYNNSIEPVYNPNQLVNELTIGIIGLGESGAMVGKWLSGLGCNIIGYNRSPINSKLISIKVVSLDYLLASSDVITIHIPYIPHVNDEIIDIDFFLKCKRKPILINTSRAQIINYSDLEYALDNNYIRGYATDTPPHEIRNSKFEKKRILTKYNNRVIMTPHIASSALTATKSSIIASLEKMAIFLED